MILKVLGSSSAGNCYLLTASTGETLILECGVSFKKVKQALNFNLKNVVGTLVSHSHLDHCSAIRDIVAAGIPVYTSKGTLDSFGFTSHWLNRIEAHQTFSVGPFEVYSFDIKHDVVEPLCFLLRNPEMGTVLFLTDSFYCGYTFDGLNNVIVEANYCQTIIDQKIAEGVSPKFLRNRILQSHMSIDTCKAFLTANDLSQVNNVVLIHLSDSNSDAERFKREVEQLTCKTVFVAEPGLTIPFNRLPF